MSVSSAAVAKLRSVAPPPPDGERLPPDYVAVRGLE